MVTVDKIEKGLAKYLDTELMPKIPANTITKVALGTMMSMFLKKIGDIIYNLKENKMVQLMGLFNEANEIDIQLVYESLKEQIPENGLQIDIPFIGTVTFTVNDVEKLYRDIVE